ncbi:hypothetical protein KEJ45_00660 [Candidatus Bathyarchaeota archaeon]|nr:hypothetical protein [Candidatus Bathyarchaeota archaeon]
MCITLDDVSDFLRENFGKVSMILGLAWFMVGLLLLETFGSVLSALCIFFGIVFGAFGFFYELELFNNIRSFGGLGVVLTFVSIVFFSLSVALFQFLEISSISYIQVIFRGGSLPFTRAILHTDRPYLWLCGLFFWVGLCLLFLGIAVKIVDQLGIIS